MTTLLERLKLVDYLTTELDIDKKEFVEKLMLNVDDGDTGFFFSPFEAFSSSKNEYKGKVTFDSFRIRRRKRMFDMNISLAVAEGKFRQKDDKLLVESKISGFRGIFIPFLIILFLIYFFGILAAILGESNTNMPWPVLPFILIHAVFMFGIPYFMIRRGVSRMKYELERDFYYMTKRETAR
jgi:hypothetical protein